MISDAEFSNNLSRIWKNIDSTIHKIKEECKKPNFYNIESLSKQFKKLIVESRRIVDSLIDPQDESTIENLTIERLDELNQFIYGMVAAIDYVCAETFCYNQASTAARNDICNTQKEIIENTTQKELLKYINLARRPIRRDKGGGKTRRAVIRKGKIHRKKTRRRRKNLSRK